MATSRPPRARPGSAALPPDDPRLLPFLPMIYVAWANGELSADELAAIRLRVEQQPGLEPPVRTLLGEWLDPDNPPPQSALASLLATIRSGAATLPPESRRSLAALGAGLARRGDETESDGATGRALADIEAALGVGGAEASRELLGEPRVAVPTGPAATVDVAALKRILDGPHAETRAALRARLSEPRFGYRYGIPSAEYRELVLEWARILAADGYGAMSFPVEHGGGGDLDRFLAVFETLAEHDFSLVVKFGVQFGLFGGAIAMLGTERHHRRYLRDVGSLALPGCFAMSELGHGSNVRDIRTVARFDLNADGFVVTTPDDSARKEWIGNAARHGRMAVVFAQLEVPAGPCGVHAFLVPIRTERGAPLPGVRLADGGEKEGLNGVDNGRIWFDGVRIPRENLLDRYGSVAPDGTYSSPIPSASRRFFTMLGTLVGGRISVARGALSASKSGLAIAIRYGARRRQFGPANEPEVPILDYLTHQRRLMPPLATAYALDAALKDLGARYAAQAGREAGPDRLELETLAAGLKAYTTWHTVHTLQACRECCGGQGYLAVNRLAPLKSDLDVFTTFEGDNTVLLNLVAKGLLTGYRQQFGELRFSSMLRFLGRRTTAALQQLNPIVTRTTDEGHLRSADFQLGVLRYREDRLLASAARRLKQRIDDGQDSFDAFNDCQDHLMTLAHAHVERVVYERFDEVVAGAEGGARSALLPLRDLYALWAVERDAAWFLTANVVEGKKAEAVRALVNRLVVEVRGMAPALVDAFGIPDELLAAPIAFTALPESGS